MLQVLALQGMEFQGPRNLKPSVHDFSMGSNLRVLDLSRVVLVDNGCSHRSPPGFHLRLPPSLRELNLTGVRPPSLSCCVSGRQKSKQMSSP